MNSNCWVCGSAVARPYKQRNYDRALVPSDFQITDSRYGLTLALRKCGECGFIYATGDEIEQLGNLYERLEDPGYESSQDSRAYQMQWLLQWVLRLRPRARTLLDIGMGAGLLVRQARTHGLEATGIDPCRSLVQSAARIDGVGVLQGHFPHPALEGQQFDIITIIDVIEHMPDPVELLRAAADALAPDGMLLVVTPDVASVAARVLGERWWHFRLAHVGYFSRATLLRAADRAGLEAVQIRRPKWFFQIDYVAVRLVRYLPVRFVNRCVSSLAAGRFLYSRVIPTNPHDSLAGCFQRRKAN